jgi:dihydroorotate dehydrogenase (fumarate)
MITNDAAQAATTDPAIGDVRMETRYLGLTLRHPIVASASPISRTLDGMRRLEDAGASAVVMASLFEEQILQEKEAYAHLLGAGADSFAEALGYFPRIAEYEVGPDAYLELIRRAKEALDVPVIASLNGVTDTGWTRHARLIEQAGADALELNVFHIPADIETPSSTVEARYIDVVRAVRAHIRIPLAVKLGPFFSSFGAMATALVEAGADGLVLFNRFYQPDIDLKLLEVSPSLELSGPGEIRLPLLWIALLHGRLPVSLAATSGVQSPAEVIKYLLAGADVVMTTSALLRYGVNYLYTLISGTREWLLEQEFQSVDEIRGWMSQGRVPDPTAFERANYIRVLQSWKHPYL